MAALDALRSDVWIARGIVGCLIVLAVAPVLAWCIFQKDSPDNIVKGQWTAITALLTIFTIGGRNGNGRTNGNGGQHGPTFGAGQNPAQPKV